MPRKKKTQRNAGLRFNRAKMPNDIVEIIDEVQFKINLTKEYGYISKEQVVYKLIRAFRSVK